MYLLTMSIIPPDSPAGEPTIWAFDWFIIVGETAAVRTKHAPLEREHDPRVGVIESSLAAVRTQRNVATLLDAFQDTLWSDIEPFGRFGD